MNQELTKPPLPVRIITPQSSVGSVAEVVHGLARDFPAARSLAWRMFVRDTMATYRQSLLGYLWIILPPVANTLVWVFLNSQNIVKIDSGAVPYALFVLTGTVLWGAFNASVTGMLGVVGEARGTLSKLNFPHEALLMTAILKILLNVLVQTLLLVPAFIVFKTLPPAEILLFPLGLLALLLFGCAIGVILIPISTLFTDVSRGIQIVLRFGFFLTPVIYPIPESGLGRLVTLWNPVSPLLVTTRAWTIGGESPQILLFVVITLASLVVLAVGVVIYKLAMPHLIERLS